MLQVRVLNTGTFVCDRTCKINQAKISMNPNPVTGTWTQTYPNEDESKDWTDTFS